jgi:hypothetical protein
MKINLDGLQPTINDLSRTISNPKCGRFRNSTSMRVELIAYVEGRMRAIALLHDDEIVKIIDENPIIDDLWAQYASACLASCKELF